MDSVAPATASPSSSSRTIEDVRSFIHECLSLNPVVVLGSGASVGFGLPTMADLANCIHEALKGAKLTPEDQEKWKKLKGDLEQNKIGLEAALDSIGLDEHSALYVTIVETVWREVTWKDLLAFAKVVNGEELPHARLFNYLFGGSSRRVTVITPNYDRLAEYGADQVQCCHRTGFSAGYRRPWRGGDRNLRCFRPDIRQDERTVDVLKVHGSVDWFVGEGNPENVLGLPLAAENQDCLKLPPGFRPLIVPPSKEKYRQAFRDPFRSLLAEADRALKAAEAFLCVGYGFNDDHIQPYLVRALRHRAKPVVMVSRTLTDKAAEILRGVSGNPRYCAVTAKFDDDEKPVQGKARIFTQNAPDGAVVDGDELWSFDGFAREFL
ncbi:MAG: SIR2 family protein [Alphaproteobacteria bacterium]